MTEKQPEEKLLKSKDAIRIFVDSGLSEPTFRRRVRDGEITKLLPNGRLRGALYPESQVRAAAAAASKAADENRLLAQKKNVLPPTTFEQATVQDMEDMALLLEEFYAAKISVSKRAAWIERNNQVAFILRCEGRAVGCGFVLPMSEEKIMQILSSQVKPATKPFEIELYQPGAHVYLYVRAAGVHQSATKEQRRHWAARLISGMAHAVIDLGKKGVYIEKIYAQGDTILGEKALKMLGFMQIDLNASTTRKNFVLDIKSSGSAYAMRYKHELNRWRAQNEEE